MDFQNIDPDTNPRRHSSRLKSKRNKPAFKLPTREVVWKDIPSVKSPEKLNRLTPRKTVNDFTKVYNTYNFDDYEDTSDDATEPDSGSSTSSDNEVQTPSRIKNYHKRIRVASSSSDESESGPAPKSLHPECGKLPESKAMQAFGCEDGTKTHSLGTGTDDESSKMPVAGAIHLDHRVTKDDTVLTGKQDSPRSEQTDDSDNSERNISSIKRGNRSLRNSILDSDEGSEAGGSESNSENSGSDQTAGDVKSDRLMRAENLKQKQTNLFSDFKDAIAKRKSRLSTLGNK